MRPEETKSSFSLEGNGLSWMPPQKAAFPQTYSQSPPKQCSLWSLLSVRYPHRNYRLGWVSMAEIGVYEQELTYLPSSYNNKSQPIFIRQLSMLLWKLRPDHWLLPFRGKYDSVDLFHMSPLISFIRLNCPPSVLPPERQAVTPQSWDGQGTSYSLTFSNYPGNNTWVTHSSSQ